MSTESIRTRRQATVQMHIDAENTVGSIQRRLAAIALGVFYCFLLTTASAQDPAVVNAKTIHVKLENDRVRVLEATLLPGITEQVHSHPAYVTYVLKGGRIRNHAADGTVTESELKTGDAIYREPVTHAVENIGDAPIELILVELKKPG